METNIKDLKRQLEAEEALIAALEKSGEDRPDLEFHRHRAVLFKTLIRKIEQAAKQ